MTTVRKFVRIPAGVSVLDAEFEMPAFPRGAVIFALGNAASRGSPRNQFVSRALANRGFATLTLDLLVPREAHARRYDIEMIAGRLRSALRWLRAFPSGASLPIGLFGAGTGAAAALRVGADAGPRIAAIVSRAGRPDLAGETALARVVAPTLLIVGGADPGAMALNEQAWDQLTCLKSLDVVAGATHLFDEPHGLEIATERAGEWFARHLANAPARPHAGPRHASRTPAS
jgi:putative phosphoribosyl transferase